MWHSEEPKPVLSEKLEEVIKLNEKNKPLLYGGTIIIIQDTFVGQYSS